MSSQGESAGRLRRPLLVGLIVTAGVLLLFALGITWFVRPPGQKPQPDGGPGPQDTLAQGKQLYGTYCTQCHGDKGDGQGPAARFLYPKPRNFGEAKFRFVTSVNRAPLDEDLMRVITQGMPGSAMFPFGHLSESDRQALVGYVRQLTRAGVEEGVRQKTAQGGGTLTAKELADIVDDFTRPGAPLEMASGLPPYSPESVARGQAVYLKNCSVCHGNTGKGDGQKEQRDDDGTPTRPRDFTRGIFKGGRDAKNLYARIVLGIPGTPMPSASGDLRPDEIGDVINYVLSLADPSIQAKVEHRRTQLVARRVPGPLPEGGDDKQWQSAPAVPIVISPLWWRNYAEPAFQVQALHDGRTLALRLSWQDESADGSPGRTQDFQDMAAVQLFKGKEEPFLGMGTADSRIDLWLWRAGGNGEEGRPISILDDYPFDAPIYRELAKKNGKDVPDFLTARAAGNPNVPDEPSSGASSLAAQGFGSTTFRPKASQVVAAQSHRKDGRWTVILRRPLSVAAEAGVSLAPGEQCSIAFAVWDGAAGDRNGQKLVSIWHDLKVEQ